MGRLAAAFLILFAGAAAANESTSDWTPTIEMEQAVRNIAETFMSDMDEGRPEYAHIMLTEDYKARLPLSDFIASVFKFNAMAGTVTSRQIAKVTWTKDSPLPGTTATLAVVSRFANIERHCGTIAMYQAPGSPLFRVAQTESTFMTNAEAGALAEKAAQLWAERARACQDASP